MVAKNWQEKFAKSGAGRYTHFQLAQTNPGLSVDARRRRQQKWSATPQYSTVQ